MRCNQSATHSQDYQIFPQPRGSTVYIYRMIWDGQQTLAKKYLVIRQRALMSNEYPDITFKAASKRQSRYGINWYHGPAGLAELSFDAL